MKTKVPEASTFKCPVDGCSYSCSFFQMENGGEDERVRLLKDEHPYHPPNSHLNPNLAKGRVS